MSGDGVVGVRADWCEAIALYAAFCDAGGQSDQTVDLRVRYMRRLADVAASGPWVVTLDELVEFMSDRSWAPETRKSARAAIRSFYRWALRTGRVDRDPAALLPSVRVPPAKPRPVPEDVLLRAVRGTDPRNRLMVLLAAFQGLRRGEIAALHTNDLVGTSLRIHGKGGRVRVLPAHPAVAVEIMSLPTGFVFPGARDGHLSGDAVGKAMKRLLGPRWSPHTLRHRFASKAYAADRDIRAVQELLGHSKLETTQRYTAIPDGALRAAVTAAGDIAA